MEPQPDWSLHRESGVGYVKYVSTLVALFLSLFAFFFCKFVMWYTVLHVFFLYIVFLLHSLILLLPLEIKFALNFKTCQYIRIFLLSCFALPCWFSVFRCHFLSLLACTFFQTTACMWCIGGGTIPLAISFGLYALVSTKEKTTHAQARTRTHLFIHMHAHTQALANTHLARKCHQTNY